MPVVLLMIMESLFERFCEPNIFTCLKCLGMTSPWFLEGLFDASSLTSPKNVLNVMLRCSGDQHTENRLAGFLFLFVVYLPLTLLHLFSDQDIMSLICR